MRSEETRDKPVVVLLVGDEEAHAELVKRVFAESDLNGISITSLA